MSAKSPLGLNTRSAAHAVSGHANLNRLVENPRNCEHLAPAANSLRQPCLFLLPFDSPRSVRERGWRAAGRPHGARSHLPGAPSCPPHPAARFRLCNHPCFPPPSPSRSPPSRRSQRSALHASVGPAAAAQDAGSAKRRAQMAAGPRSSVVRYPLVSCSHCWMTCRLHLTMSLTSRQDFARYKHPDWKRLASPHLNSVC